MYEYLNNLNEEQKEVATTINGPILIIAGAGSGKTTTLISRLTYMIDNGINPENILLLTFTNEAAKNMIKKAADNSNPLCKNITACTYHSFCANILRKYGEVINIPHNYEIISQSDAEDIIKVLKQKKLIYKIKGFPSNKQIVSYFSYITNIDLNNIDDITYITENKYPSIYPFFNEMQQLKEDYCQYKKDRNLLDYDDLLVQMLELLKLPDYKSIIQDKYRYIMVDEYQDTNRLQEQIVLTIGEKYHNIAVVGDDYQSIYAFRGSDINNIINFPSKVPNCKEITLHKNYRSTDEIIQIANVIMSNHAHFGYPKQMTGTNQKNILPYIDYVSNSTSEAKFIFDDIIDKHQKGFSYKDIAVLSRTSNETAELEALLNKANISYTKKGGLKFFEHDCIRDILAYFKILVNQKDELAWSRVLDVIPGIGNTYSANISFYCDSPDFLRNNQYQKKSFYKDLLNLDNLFKLLNMNVGMDKQFFKIKEHYVSLRQKAINNLITSDEGNRTAMQDTLKKDIELIDCLWTIMQSYPNIHSFLDDIVLSPNISNTEEDGLVLSTIHSSKGLEWDVLYILNPINHYIISETTQEDFDEGLRLFYVAITRAKKEIHFIVPQNFSYAGKDFCGDITNVCYEARQFMQIKKEDKYNKPDSIIYLNVSYNERNYVKARGARWDNVRRLWYVKESFLEKYPELKFFRR